MHGYHRLSYEQKNQLQPMAGYRQTRNLPPGVSQSRREKTTTNGRYLWQFKYVNIILIVVCTSNDLICAYITSIHLFNSSQQIQKLLNLNKYIFITVPWLILMIQTESILRHQVHASLRPALSWFKNVSIVQNVSIITVAFYSYPNSVL